MASKRLLLSQICATSCPSAAVPAASASWWTSGAQLLATQCRNLTTTAPSHLQASPSTHQQQEQQQQASSTASTPPPPTQSQGEQQQQQQSSPQQEPDYAQIRARIFGEPIRLGERTGRRVLARPLQGAQLASWYFMPPRVPGTHNEEAEYVNLRKLNKRSKKKEEAPDAKKKKK